MITLSDPDPFRHVHEAVRHLCTAPDSIRKAHILSDRYLSYPRGEEVVARLLAMASAPRRRRMTSLLVYAAPNMGKTTLIDRFLALYRRATEDSGASTVVSMQAPPTVDEKRFYAAFLEALPALVPDTTVTRLAAMVRRQLEARNVRLLIIDEMQHILGQRPAAVQVVLNTLKCLSNELSISIAGFGTGEAKSLIKSDPHLAERFDVVGLPEWAKKTKWTVDVVREKVAWFPLRQPTEVDRALMDMLRRVAGNLPGRWLDYLERAALEAINSGVERITPEILKLVAERRDHDESDAD